MTKDELIKKLQDIEWEDFEVKEACSELPRNLWQTVSAFANTTGGWIVLGVKKSGKQFEIKGVANPEKIEQDFTTALRGDKFNVKILPTCKKYSFKERTVLGFYIPLSDKKPIYFNTLANTFIRTASGDQRATKEEIDAMYRDQAFGTHTSKPIGGVSSKALNSSSVQRYREYMTRLNPSHKYNNLTTEEFLQKLRVISNGDVTYSGLLFFGNNDDIQTTFPDFRIDYFEIPGTSLSKTGTRHLFRMDEQENLWEYYFTIFERLRKYLDIPFEAVTAGGFAFEDYPQLEAVREALVNMLMHTDYFSSAKPRIRVFDDRMEFWNPGALPKPIDQIMAEDITMPRNPILAKLFRVVKLAENAGYGFNKMISSWQNYTGKEPNFEPGRDFTKAVFEFQQKTGQATSWRKVKKRLDVKLGVRLGVNAWKVLEQIWIHPKITIIEMSEKIGISTTAVENNISKLRNNNLLERIGSDKTGIWIIPELENRDRKTD